MRQDLAGRLLICVLHGVGAQARHAASRVCRLEYVKANQLFGRRKSDERQMCSHVDEKDGPFERS